KLHWNWFLDIIQQIMQIYLIKNIQVVNEGSVTVSDVLIKNGWIERIEEKGIEVDEAAIEIDGEGRYLLPGAIDDQVHFREPGLTHKATIYTEARAAVDRKSTRLNSSHVK